MITSCWDFVRAAELVVSVDIKFFKCYWTCVSCVHKIISQHPNLLYSSQILCNHFFACVQDWNLLWKNSHSWRHQLWTGLHPLQSWWVESRGEICGFSRKQFSLWIDWMMTWLVHILIHTDLLLYKFCSSKELTFSKTFITFKRNS